MTTSDFTVQYTQRRASEQIAFLARLAAEITLWARGTYDAGTEHVLEPEQLRSFNEWQHRVAWQLVHLLQNDPRRYSDDAFAQIMAQYAESLHCLPSLLKLFEQSHRETARATA